MNKHNFIVGDKVRLIVDGNLEIGIICKLYEPIDTVIVELIERKTFVKANVKEIAPYEEVQEKKEETSVSPIVTVTLNEFMDVCVDVLVETALSTKDAESSLIATLVSAKITRKLFGDYKDNNND